MAPVKRPRLLAALVAATFAALAFAIWRLS